MSHLRPCWLLTQGYLAALSASAYSYVSMLQRFGPIMNPGGAAISLTYLASEKIIPGALAVHSLMHPQGTCLIACDSSMENLGHRCLRASICQDVVLGCMLRSA